ncbi:DUF2063 domain-containing protein [Legionella sp. km772]|uniref:HvfC/BufC N-terminal domain-containing protein n=1 Tax=Legionella sp. km772 TaxID=2498111 RepID=UPI000F8DD7D9|nr:putative DNA-binding domain-containing protein [Legionella sp. km772]RUR13736.1 DUF2063 domain-containing protein [Legionella sp. km772]
MSELSQLQQQFQQFILAGKPDIMPSVLSTKDFSAEKRLGIYRDAYQLRLIECLTTTFPALHSYLGTEEFQKMCRCFIDAHPSYYRSIRWYGDLLSVFLKNYYDKAYSFLAELADFEWKMTLAFDAEDTKRVSIEEMAALAPEAWVNLSFIVHPSVQRPNYFWNALPLWKALVDDKELPNLVEDTAARAWLLWRSADYVIQYYSLGKEEAWMMDGMLKGLSFSALCEGLCEWIAVDKVAMTAAGFLKSWITKGILAELKVA